MKYKPVRAIYRKIDNFLADKIIAVADSAKDELTTHGVEEEKIKVIINGTLPLKESTKNEKDELKERLKIDKNALIVGISARLEKYKGHKTLIKAAEIIKKQGIDDIIFLILGTGSYGDELKKYAESLGVSNRIIFLGFRESVDEYVNLFDINVNCSTGTETSSLAISEGLSLGKPVIASDFGGNPNMVKDGETGFIFPQNDAEALAEKIIFLKANSDTLKYMSNQAKLDFAERFSVEIMAREYEKFYSEMLQ
jgi:glycosyltransferase involved in cell wall biosynthesis